MHSHMVRRLATVLVFFVLAGFLLGGGLWLLARRPPAPADGCRPAPACPDDPARAGPPFFQEVQDSGIDFTYRSGEEADNHSILQLPGGGVALIDYDGDGLLDVFLPGGGGFEGADGRTIVGNPCRLYKNLGNFKFKDVTKEVGLGDFPWFYTHGAAVADYDRDGWPDLLVTGWGRVALFHNEPVDPDDPAKGRKFVDVAEKAGLTGITWATSAAWADLDGDGYPDLYVTQYVDWSWENDPRCFNGDDPDICVPQRFNGLRHKLFANVGGKRFRDVTDEAGLRPGGPDAGKGLGVLAVDVNGDGKPDLYVCNDTTDNFLYINRCTPGHFRFEEVGAASGTARDALGKANGSMGVDAGDYDGCGRPSLWVTNYEDEQHALYHNDCRGDRILFFHRTTQSGIGAIGQKYVGWGTGFLDMDHHGWEDLFIANGHAALHPMEPGSARRQRPVLLRNMGGRFEAVTVRGGPYFQRDHLARGAALGDLDNDGRVDILVSHLNEPATVLRNLAAVGSNHWLGIELAGRDGADVVGAAVRLEAGGRAQARFAKGGGSHLSSGDRRLVFGLAGADRVTKVAVYWPNGEEQTFAGDVLPVDHYWRLVQGDDAPRGLSRR